MTFSKKIFISVFFTAFALGSAIIWMSHRYVIKQSEEKFISRYSVFAKVLSDTLSSLDNNTEKLMLNAAKVIAAKDDVNGLLSTESLKKMRSELNVTHIFVLDAKGNFIRSTNEDPKLIPNGFSFCPSYVDMITGNSDTEATPIIHPKPEPKPYKFLFVPNSARTRLLEVGIRVDFVAKTLSEALGSDENVESMTLYDPHGTIFGSFNSKEVDFKTGTVSLPATFPKVVDAGNSYHFFTKVKSSHPRCCQCDVSKTSKNGEYYYVLEANVSKSELSAVLASTTTNFTILGIGNLLLAWVLSRILSRRLVRNIERAASKVREIQVRDDLTGRVNLSGHDEVAFLTNEFDKLLEKLEDSQRKLVEAEKIQTKVQMAREVAHNIKSPVLALEMIFPLFSSVPTKAQSVLRNSIKEIKGLTDRLRSQADTLVPKCVQSELELDLLFLPSLMREIVNSKTEEFQNQNTSITYSISTESQNLFIRASAMELRCILSNLINNAAESYPEGFGPVNIDLKQNEESVEITISDSGVGIPQEFISILGKKPLTFKGGQERGIGLMHAFRSVKNWGGDILIDSKLGSGTTVRIQLPKYEHVRVSSPETATI